MAPANTKYECKSAITSCVSNPSKTNNYDRRISYDRLHRMYSRANPDQVTKYRLSLLLHKAYNDQNQGSDWESINFNQNFNAQLQTVFFFRTATK